jgi:hypothetical protein
MIHIDSEPPTNPGGLHTVQAKDNDDESIRWIEEHKPRIAEAWIYDALTDVRVIAYYLEV